MSGATLTGRTARLDQHRVRAIRQVSRRRARAVLTPSCAPARRLPGKRAHPRSRALRTSGFPRRRPHRSREACAAPACRPRASRAQCRSTTPARASGGYWRSASELVERPGGQVLADVAPSGGRHLHVLFAAAGAAQARRWPCWPAGRGRRSPRGASAKANRRGIKGRGNGGLCQKFLLRQSEDTRPVLCPSLSRRSVPPPPPGRRR
jgi:hypothetical protein